MIVESEIQILGKPVIHYGSNKNVRSDLGRASVALTAFEVDFMSNKFLISRIL
jgi:hypothetical protein